MKTNKTILLALPGLLSGLLLSLQSLRAQPAEKEISWYITHCPFPMTAPAVPQFPAHDFLLTDYGGTPDGHTLNTTAFQQAIAACSAAGGGRVVVGAGKWLTGPIELRSHVNLYLAANAIVQFSSDHSLYPPIGGHKGGAITPPLYGHDLEDVAITGPGSFDGAGESWRPVKKEKMTPAQWQGLLSSGGVLSPDGKIWWPGSEARDETSQRPVLFSLNNCHRILIKDVELRNSPKYVFYPSHCTDLTLDHTRIFNDWWAQNGDGIDISACKNVILFDCMVNAGDDGICMKSSGGGSDGPALENVIIAGCTVYRAHGGFVIGSNTDGGMHDIFVRDCQFIGTDVGLRFKSNMGRGGLVDDIFISDIQMQHIVHEAVLFDTYYENMEAGVEKNPNKVKSGDKTPEFRDFQISRVFCDGAQTGIAITGLPQMPVSKISFDSLEIHSTKGLVATQAKDIDLHDVRWVVQEEPAVQADKTAEIRVH